MLTKFINVVDCTQSHYGVHCSVEPYLWGLHCVRFAMVSTKLLYLD